jgi:hypothetical protein
MARWVLRPFRGNPEPEPALRLAPEPAPERAPLVDVMDSTWQAANVLAQRVWNTGAQPA